MRQLQARQAAVLADERPERERALCRTWFSGECQAPFPPVLANSLLLSGLTAAIAGLVIHLWRLRVHATTLISRP